MATGLRIPEVGGGGGGFYDRAMSSTKTGLSAYTSQVPGQETTTETAKSAGGALMSGAGMASGGAELGTMIGGALAKSAIGATAESIAAGAAAGGLWGAGIIAGAGILAYLLS